MRWHLHRLSESTLPFDFRLIDPACIAPVQQVLRTSRVVEFVVSGWRR
jgi:hypothetical protein